MKRALPKNEYPINMLCKAKRKDNGEWTEGFYFYDSALNKHYIKSESDHEILPETICRFANRIDSNGKKIFEHDIGTVMTPVCCFPLENGEILWNEEEYCWDFEDVFKFMDTAKIIREPLSKAKFIEIRENRFDKEGV